MNNNIITTVLSLVKIIDKENLAGYEKKNEVYSNLKKIMGEESFKANEQIINFILETIIYISKTHNIGINKNTFNYCCK